MRAAVVTDFHAPLELQEMPVPEPGPGEVLVRIDYSGLCHTDIHAARGDWPVKPTPPFVPTRGDRPDRAARRRRDRPGPGRPGGRRLARLRLR